MCDYEVIGFPSNPFEWSKTVTYHWNRCGSEVLYYETIKQELNKRLIQGVGVMKDKELKIEKTEVSHTLGGTIKYT